MKKLLRDVSRLEWKRRSLVAFAALGALAALGACSVDAVKFASGDPAPDAATDATPDATPDAPLVLVEICATPGDEDGNGMADCMDPACVAGMSTCGATAACNTDCTLSRCGDSKRNPAANEACDTGTDDTRTCDGDCTLPQCGDGRFNVLAEENDPAASPSTAVPMSTQTCRYDFSTITQLYCNSGCSLWDGVDGCQQGDADALCKLRTGNPGSTATTFVVGVAAAAPGVCCALGNGTQYGCKVLGMLPTRGVMVSVSIHDTDVRSTHGAGPSITNVTCSNP